MKPLSLLFFLLLLSVCCFADEQRIQTKFTSENKEYTIEYKKGGKWHLKNKAGRTLYKIKRQGFTSMTMFVSNDGKNVVVFNDFKEGRTIEDDIAIWFYTDGKLQNSYKFIELLDDTCNVMTSIWHVTWAFDEKLNNLDKTFSFSTFEFYDYAFDAKSGQLLKKERPGFDEHTIIVYGNFKIGNSSKSIINIQRYVAGNKVSGDKLIFKTDRFGPGNWNRPLMIQNGIDITPSKFSKQFIGYSCLNE
jgi:hypothetical protein